MNIDKEKFFAALLAAGLVGATACGGGAEPVEEEQGDVETSGSEDAYAAEPPADTGDDLEADVAEEETAEEDLGPTPE